MIAAALLAAAACVAPIREFPSTNEGRAFAVILTGDGGWRRIDDQIARHLHMPVAGFLVPAYYREMRTPDESACALEKTIRTYQAKWKRDRVILIGYSRGADVLPFMINRLSADVRACIDEIALLGLEPYIDFRYHPSWVPFVHWHEPQFPVLPETQKLRGMNVLCVYGEEEKDSLCPALSSWATVVREPGSHHFGGNYRAIAKAIISQAARRSN